MKKKIILAGGTGFIGSQLSKELINRRYSILIITRKSSEKRNDENIAFKTWDALQPQDFEGVAGIINLAGASIAGSKWTDNYKNLVLESRINATKALINLVSKTQSPPKVFINASAVGYYGDRGDELLNEESSSGKGFLAKVCIEWEKEALNASKYTRTVMSRIGVVLDKNEGALSKMLLPFKMFAGGPLGTGKQYFPWIHIDDIVNLFIFSLENESINGPINFASPNPVTMEEFAKSLGKAMGRPAFFKVPEFGLKLMLGESAEMITNSQRVIPQVALSNGYKFKYSDVSDALNAIMSR